MLTRKTLTVATLATIGVILPLAALRPAARAQGTTATPPNTSSRRWMSQAMARVSAVHAVPGEVDAEQLSGQGRSLSPPQAASLELSLTSHPNDLAKRIQLLGYYGRQRFRSAEGKKAYDRQVFWLIRNHPTSVLAGRPDTLIVKRDDPGAFAQGEALWLTQAAKQHKNPVILANAAAYCELSDEPTAERLFKRAISVDPKNPEWPNRLGELYHLQLEGRGHTTVPPDTRRRWAEKALAQYEAAAALNKNSPSAGTGDMAKTAFDAGEYAKARQYAAALLQKGGARQGWDPSGDIHYGNLILGRLALRDGDVAGAEAHLLAMGRITGSPSLDTFGPNMQLAQDLLRQGDRAPVLAYLDECGKFWSMGSKALATWRAQVQQGQTPDFSANLYY